MQSREADKMAKITLDGEEFIIDEPSEKVKSIMGSIKFIDSQIQQKASELAIADTARIGYLRAIKGERNGR